MKILGLDLGDRWVGSALSDLLGISCKPYRTVQLNELDIFLEKILTQEHISTVVIGYPRTLSGGTSEQTLKIVNMKESLEKKFAAIAKTPITWILWDERLSSKRACEILHHASTPEAKKKNHSIAAAFILQSYLDYLAFNRNE